MNTQNRTLKEILADPTGLRILTLAQLRELNQIASESLERMRKTNAVLQELRTSEIERRDNLKESEN